MLSLARCWTIVRRGHRELDSGVRRLHAYLKQAGLISCSLSSVYRILRRCGALVRRPRKPKPVWIRYAKAMPGERAQMDLKYLPEQRFQLTLVDDCSRFLGATILEKRTMAAVCRALPGVLHSFPLPLRCIQTDNGSEFGSELTGLLQHLGIGHTRIRPRTPRLNGKVERVQRTVQEEFWDDIDGGSLQDWHRWLRDYVQFYNRRRLHSALGYQTPFSYALDRHNDVRDGIVQEDITVSADAPAFGGERVDSAAKADAQSEAILEHTLAATDGYLYAETGQYLLAEGNCILPNGTYMAADGGTTQDVALAAKDASGKPVITTTDKALAAKNASDQPIRAWTSDKKAAATDASGAPVASSLRTTAQTSAFLRTSLWRGGDGVQGLRSGHRHGVFLVAVGATFILFLAPAVYYAAELANERVETESTKTTTRPAAPMA